MAKYEEHRTFISGIIEAMTRAEADLTARLDEVRSQKKMLEETIDSLNVFEHINNSKE